MEISLTHEDLKQMPNKLSSDLLAWLNRTNQTIQKSKLPTANYSMTSQPPLLQLLDNQKKSVHKCDRTHLPLTELFDAGITKPKMPVRVRLTQKLAQKQGRDYINSMEISKTGTIHYQGIEFNKPSPLATKVNNNSVNGWDYVEVKHNNQWVSLNQLRQIYRKTSA